MTIGAGWAENAFVDASWVVGAWEQPTTTKTIGDTSQIGAYTSTGGITVVTTLTIGGVCQLEAISSTGQINLGWQIGGTSQLLAFSSTGAIQVGDEPQASGSVSSNRTLTATSTNRKMTFTS